MESTGNSPAPDDTPRSFDWLYTLAVWAGTVLMIVLTVAVLWTLFVHTASGTSRGLSVETSKATQTAVFAAMPTPTLGAGVVELPATCRGCHTIEGTNAAGKVCPDLTHIATTAEAILASGEYAGGATSVEDYIRESILDPNAYIVADKASYYTTDASGKRNSLMPAAIGAALSQAELDEIVSYLASLD